MKRTLTTYAHGLGTLLAAGVLAMTAASCFEREPSKPTTDDGDDLLAITLSLKGSAAGTKAVGTRVNYTDVSDEKTEAGKDALNENTIRRIDFFLFDADGSLEKHVAWPGSNTTEAILKKGSGTTLTDTLVMSGFPGTGFAGKDVYIVANWTEAGAEAVNSLKSLQAASTVQQSTDTSKNFVPNAIQNAFLMDGCLKSIPEDKVKPTTSDGTVMTTIDEVLELRRAVAKIRVHVHEKGEDGKGISSDAIYFKLVNYASTVAVVADSSLSFSRTVTPLDTLLDRTATMTGEGNSTGSEVDDGYLTVSKGTIAEAHQHTHADGNTYDYVRSVYVCPNYWMTRTDVRQEMPIDLTRYTHIMLRAPYNGVYYYYLIPLMYRMPDDSDTYDTTTDSGWETFKTNYETWYCVRRNHIYDITVDIDRPGGVTEPKSVLLTNLMYQAIDWTEYSSETIDFN